MMIGAKEGGRFDQPARRLALVWHFAVKQLRMRRYPLAGLAHMFIFVGFVVLLLRSLILWGRGFDESFHFWIFGPDQWLGQTYSFFKDVFAVLVILGTLVFFYYRLIARLPRMTLSTEGLIILSIILMMMLADILYDAANLNLRAREHRTPGVTLAPVQIPNEAQTSTHVVRLTTLDAEGRPISVVQEPVDDPGAFETKQTGFMEEPESPLAQASPNPPFLVCEPAGSVAARFLGGLSDGPLTFLKHMGFWTHSALVLIFLNLLPYSKHFHIITGVPNVYTQSLHPARLPPIVDMDGKLERGETLGIKRIDQFSWKAILDFYTCTECGRCSDHCPATKTGKKLSPKHFTLDLRDFLYQHDAALTSATKNDNRNGHPLQEADAEPPEHHKDLVDGVIDPEVLWACTSCRACEVECPVFISYVDKIVDMRRYLVQERGEFPNELQTAFRSLESAFNPWGFPAEDRGQWAENLGVKTLAEHPEAEVIFWVGCMPSFDDRAKRVTRATAQLMQRAGVDFAILASEEQCTGDPARRAGNEYLFQLFAKTNVETLNRYAADKKRIVTTCPHCLNTLLNEYPDFGGRYEVVHHSTFLSELLRQGKLKPQRAISKRVVFHDSCYLGRYNDVYDAPRDVLKSIPGLTVLEPVQTRDRGMCCGAGGAQMFKEEEHGDQRVNQLRTRQLLDTNPDAVSSACPFCMRMLTDGLADHDKSDIPQLDFAEMLWESISTPPTT